MKRKKNILELTRWTVQQYKALPKNPLIVLTDNVRSMHNIGSIFRTADAFLIEEVILGGISGCPPHPEIRKTALGAEESVKWHHTENSLKTLLDLKKNGWTICVLEQTHDSMPLNEYKRNKEEKCVLVVGNEVTGVDQNIVDIADVVLEIPQYGTKHSLNVSVSAGIALYALCIR